VPYTLAAVPQEAAHAEIVKFNPDTVSSAITAVGSSVDLVKKVAIGTAVAVGFLVVWNVFVK